MSSFTASSMTIAMWSRSLRQRTVAVAPYVVAEPTTSRSTPILESSRLTWLLDCRSCLPRCLQTSTDIARAGAGLIVADNPEAIADGIQNLLADRQTWRAASQASFEYARRFDWNAILSSTLEAVGFT